MTYIDPMRYDPFGNPLHNHLFYKNGAYHHVARVDGRVRWKRLASTYAEALSAWAAIEGGALSPRTISEVWALYSTSNRGLLRLATSTQRGYRASFERPNNGMLLVFGHMRLDDLRRSDVLAYLEAREEAGAPVAGNRDVAAMGAVYKFARDRDLTNNEPCKVARNKETPRERVASKAERSALTMAVPPLWRCILAVAYLTGMRQGELRMLRRSDVSDLGLNVGRLKGGQDNGYTWSDALREAIDTALALQPPKRPSMYVFPGPRTKGQPYTADGFRTNWDKYRKKAGIEGLTFHDLRRTSANAAKSLEHARALLGHSSAAVTRRVYRSSERVDPVE